MVTDIVKRVRHALLSADVRKAIAQHEIPSVDGLQNTVKFTLTDAAITPWDVLIERKGGAIHIAWRSEVLRRRHFRLATPQRVLPYLYYVALAGDDADRLVCDLSDGDQPSVADVGFSSPFSERGLVPDLYFFETRGYQKQRDQFRNARVPWADRSNLIQWRGSLNGNGLRIANSDLIGNGMVNQRLRLAYACKDTDIDFKFIDQNDANEMLKKEGIWGARVAATTWLNHKYAIDVDGHSNAWDNLYHRMLFGCCVLKVDSQVGFRQWYYPKLKPFEHFVPIKADLSDLREQVDWVSSHPKEAEAIARAGCELAHSMTFDSETQFAAAEIKRICKTNRAIISAKGSSSQAGQGSSGRI